MSNRVEQFREYVVALNKQFVDWVQQQWQRKPAKFWSSGLHDYLRHQAKIRREFADVIEEDNSRPDGASPGSKQVVYEPQLSIIPYCNTKVIHFVRHGEGFHNIGLITLDSHLTEKGWAQAHALGKHMYSTPPCHQVQLVVVSPMMRTLETAAGIFGVPTRPFSSGGSSSGSLMQLTGANGGGGGGGLAALRNGSRGQLDIAAAAAAAEGSEGVLMEEQGGEDGIRIAHARVVARPGVHFIAHELCRERLGPGVCDKRRPLSESRAAFPAVDFSLIEHEEDVMWETQHVEPESAVVVRGMKFMQYLMSRPESHIAVVTHSAFLWFTLACFGNEYSKKVRENLQRWYENCEMRTVVLCDGGGGGLADMTWFPGGHAYSEPQEAAMEEDTVVLLERERRAEGSTPPAVQRR